MGREIRRVPLDFMWPLGEVWQGFIQPDRLREKPCDHCQNGYSPHAEQLRCLWYGNLPFHPAITGSAPLTADTPAVRDVAEHNVKNSPDYYGNDDRAIAREARRLAELWNSCWRHHLAQEDVDALVVAGRLYDFTHRLVPGKGWQPIKPMPRPTATEVNDWSVRHGLFGHDACNAWVAIRARCERDGYSHVCAFCEGNGSVEAYPGQRAEAEAWEATQPPAGEGWQLWETVSEGSPLSPVFATAEELAQWLTTSEGGEKAGPSQRPMTIEQARGFVKAGWAPSMFLNVGGLHDGAEFVGTQEALRGHAEET